MIHSLLSVCLLTMGVGAKASTPIELNRQETQPTQQRQYANEINANASLTGNSTQTWTYNTDQSYDRGDGFTNFLNEEYEISNSNIQVEFNQYGRYEYDQLDLNNNNFYWIPDYILDQNIKRPKEVYRYKIYGTSLGFSNTTITLKLNPADIEIDGYYTYEPIYTTNIEIYQSNKETTYTDPINMYKEFTEGDLKATCTKYSYRNMMPQTPEIELAVNPTPNTNNYFYIFVNYFATTLNQNDYEQFKTDVNNGDIKFLCRGDPQYKSKLSAPRLVRPPQYTEIFNTQIIELAEVTQEVIDLPGLLWEILAMPFAFLSTAFNLTIFPGTIYQINIANLVLTIFGVLVFVFILKKIKR